jgi:hypothetical protein
MNEPELTDEQKENDAFLDNLQAVIDGVVKEASNQEDAVRRLIGAGFSPSTASLYAAHHYCTFRGDCVDLSKQ